MTLIKVLLSRTYPILQKRPATQISNFSNYFQRCRTSARNSSSRTPFQSSRSNDILRGKLPEPVNEPVYESSLLKQLLFTVGFAGTTFVGVTIWEYENFRSHVKGGYHRLKNNNFISELKNAWHTLPTVEKFFIPICALNVLVFGLWRIPSMKGFMYRYFCSNPASKSTCIPMVLSTFSHFSLFHIFANMYVLHSFSHAFTRGLGIEQATGVYLTAGVVSSLASYVFKRGAKVHGYSLGASGAVMAVLGYVCTQFPDNQISIIFLPWFHFSAETGIKAIMALDLAGCLLGWKLFDHAAHLGGALFGIFWCYYGKEIWMQRKVVMQKWHNIRSGQK